MYVHNSLWFCFVWIGFLCILKTPPCSYLRCFYLYLKMLIYLVKLLLLNGRLCVVSTFHLRYVFPCSVQQMVPYCNNVFCFHFLNAPLRLVEQLNVNLDLFLGSKVLKMSSKNNQLMQSIKASTAITRGYHVYHSPLGWLVNSPIYSFFRFITRILKGLCLWCWCF